MASQMNSQTYKVLTAFYEGPSTIYAIPKDWLTKDIEIRKGVLFYKGDSQQYLRKIEHDGDENCCFPAQVELTGEDVEDLEFDEEEEDEEEERPLCKDCEVETRKHCDECGGYGSNSEDEEECDDCEGKCQSNETETCEKCAVKLRIGCANNPSDESIFNGLCDACREEEEEEEVRCVCPKCFAEGHTFVSKERAKELEKMEEMEEMCPFGEKCNGEEEMPTVEGTPGSVLPPNVVNTIRAWLEKKQAPLCFRINGGECKQCNSLCVDEEDSLCHKCYHKSNPVECYCDEEENRAWSKEKKIKI
mgnify:FL=1|jgi:hypothetical protein